ncbi:MAG: hypothetical protein UT02_C0048G0008 [Parcubacteria group bacterium GW2011_GWC2_38_7]|nr:MAG: hypothetical protein UT02_C0048G0008 [Parcubacteria group bacterium GW2011_GWC2_38_7]
MDREMLVQRILELLADVSKEHVPAVLAEVNARRGVLVPKEQGKSSVQTARNPSLTFVGTTTVPALTETFLVSDRFKKKKQFYGVVREDDRKSTCWFDAQIPHVDEENVRQRHHRRTRW